MTTHYLELKVLPDPEVSIAQLLGTLYGRLHMTLVQQKRSDVGISFPQYSLNPRGMGNVLRLHSSESALRSLMQDDWLKGMRDHIRMTDILPVPDATMHCVFRRKQFKTNAERLRRRRMKRKGETAAQAAEAIPATIERKPNLPYVHLRSHSTAQPFCMFVERGKPQSEAVQGAFSCYGLSLGTTVPWF